MYVYFDAIQLYRCTFLNNETVNQNYQHKSIKDTPIMSPYVVLDYFNGHPRSKLKDMLLIVFKELQKHCKSYDCDHITATQFSDTFYQYFPNTNKHFKKLVIENRKSNNDNIEYDIVLDFDTFLNFCIRCELNLIMKITQCVFLSSKHIDENNLYTAPECISPRSPLPARSNLQSLLTKPQKNVKVFKFDEKDIETMNKPQPVITTPKKIHRSPSSTIKICSFEPTDYLESQNDSDSNSNHNSYSSSSDESLKTVVSLRSNKNISKSGSIQINEKKQRSRCEDLFAWVFRSCK